MSIKTRIEKLEQRTIIHEPTVDFSDRLARSKKRTAEALVRIGHVMKDAVSPETIKQRVAELKQVLQW